MSQQSSRWLNTMVRVGYVAKHGDAWWRSLEEVDGIRTHWDGPVPYEEAHRLLDWEPLELPVQTTLPDGTLITDEKRKHLVHPTSHAFLGTNTKKAPVHVYREWLLEEMQNLLGAGLGIASVGLLQDGAVAWVQAEAPETVEGPHGEHHRPFITAAGALNSSMSTTYQRGTIRTVCDNTLSLALSEVAIPRIRIRRTSQSLTSEKREHIADVLGVITETSDLVNQGIERLVATSVSDKVFAAFVAELCQPDVPKGTTPTPKALRSAQARASLVTDLYHNDARVAEWQGTAWGAVQAANTYTQHIKPVRNVTRAERTTWDMVRGEFQNQDQEALATLRKVLATV